jgi:ABC-type antimicrobial peptide transport system permease subunit
MRGGVTPENTKTLENVLADFPDANLQTEQQFIDNELAGLDKFLILLYVLLALSIVVSLFGIVNTLVLTVFERTREIGMLRAVGMTRRQTRRMIRHESVVTALIGAALGIPLGMALAGLFDNAIGGGVPFSVPWVTIVVFVVAAIVVGLIAAIFPARRASRLNVLQALQYE